MTALNLIFAGTPAFAVPALEALVAAGHQVCAVYTQPDRPAGRGQHLQFSAVKECALKHSLSVHQPLSLRDPKSIAELSALQADAMIVVAYGLILPLDVLSAPRFGCINIHASLLPRWRGAAPIQRAIEAGDTHTGVCIMRMEQGLDTGPVIRRTVTEIQPHETAAELHDRLSMLGARALVDVLPDYVAGKLLPEPQSDQGVTYAAKLSKAEARINWQRSAREIDAAIRAFNPWPVSETRLHDKQLRIWQAQPTLHTQSQSQPGTVLRCDQNGITVATGAGELLITRLQLAGRTIQTASEFIRAHPLENVVLQ
jgi:methionyl-tRNA formyltransferase